MNRSSIFESGRNLRLGRECRVHRWESLVSDSSGTWEPSRVGDRPVGVAVVTTPFGDIATTLNGATHRFLVRLQDGSAPKYPSYGDGPLPDSLLAGLVLDRILDFEGPDGFVSGPRAWRALGDGRLLDRVAGIPSDELKRVSWEAVRMASHYQSDVWAVAAFLYRYNRAPVSSQGTDPLSAIALTTHGMSAESTGAFVLANGWKQFEPEKGDPWQCWFRILDSGSGPIFKNQPSAHVLHYKLYLSPHPRHARDVLTETLRVIPSSGAFALKVGLGRDGLLRPDKLVAYLPSHQELMSLAGELLPRIGTADAQGVPFTTSVPGGGLLASWAVDTPRVTSDSWSPDKGSWRQWIVVRLARALGLAWDAREYGISALDHSLARVVLEGLSPGEWIPPWCEKGCES